MTKIIAEIGWNHMGDMELAKEMIAAANESGADIVKTQTFDIKRLKQGPWDTDGRRDIYKKAQLSLNQHIELRDYSNQIGIQFISSVFSVDDARLLRKVETDMVKIPSMESRNIKLINHCVDNFDKIIISTGTSTLDEISDSVKDIPKEKLTLLHCVSSYPCNFDVVNLPRILDLEELSNSVGYSDHTQGIEASVMSLSYNVKFIEKHFTIDNDLPGRDNKFAILPNELKRLKEYIDIHSKVNLDYGSDYQKCEEETREIYSGRWDGLE
jgi:sialic acid synthase SpsE